MPIAPKIRFQVKHNDSDPPNTEIHVQSGATAAQYAAFANAYANAMDDIVIGAVQPIATMSIPVDVSDLANNTLDPASDVEQKAAFQFLAADGEPVDVTIPGLIPGDIAAGADGLNTADTQVAAFIALMETGNGTIAPSSISESDIVDTLYARRETTPSGKKRR